MTGRGQGRPVPSSPKVTQRFQAVRRRDTEPELAIRRRLHADGFRYRVDARLPLAGVFRRCDLLFPGPRVAVFVDSCFWHACPKHGTWPRTNAEWWRNKLMSNRARDEDTDRRLRDQGWEVARVWEHEDPDEAAERIESLIARRQEGGSGRRAGGRSRTA